MKEADLAPFQELASELEPVDPIQRIVWLFNDYRPAIPELDTPSFDLSEKTRESTLRNLLMTEGTDAVLNLANAAKHPELVAVACGAVLETVEEFATVINAATNRTDNLAVFASVLSAQAELRHSAPWRAQITSWKAQQGWTDRQLVDILLNWRDEPDTWNFLLSLGAEINHSYWERKRPWGLYKMGADHLDMAARSYLGVGRAVAAIQATSFSARLVSTEILFEMLDSAVLEFNTAKVRVNSEMAFQIEQVFDALQEREEIPKIEIARREYAYLALFQYADRSLTLHRVMAEDPTFYASLLTDAFRPKSGEVPEPSEERRAVASAAYQLLSKFRVLPGMRDGQIDAVALSSWVQEVRRLAKEGDRAEIGDEFVGHLLANAPGDSDGAWPHRTVRDVIENERSKELELGIEIERFNMRGVHVRAMYGGGAPERGLAEEVRQTSRVTKEWPRTAAMLERIAESWDRTAAQADERARQDKLRDA